MKPAINSLKLGVSCLVFNSTKMDKVLLIQREKNPMAGKWSFPGGRLDPGESIFSAMKREVYEETGFDVDILKTHLISANETGEYLVLSGMAILHETANENEAGRTAEDKKIVKKFFSTNHVEPDNIWKLRSEDCIPNLQHIVKRFIFAYNDKLISNAM